ncbi:hypothetical protein N7492_004441 [Penicillium capsulatum]|uniref:Uncharacterized protein n=1 Tax=Penicillium capsulatum TaxID=69766 RepID=A0A9W9LR58_9EURO|nr:hypothetical protein N7492_004441 [Penicillium capsulatum]KAJ6136439.1 hypothetical protein N7512_001599 [Penicillium capsulatum]
MRIVQILAPAAVGLLATLIAASPLNDSNHVTKDKQALERRVSVLGKYWQGSGGQVSWSGIAPGDGVKTGKDPDGIYYFLSALEHFVNSRNDDERVGVFRTGGENTEEVENDMNEFNGDVLDGAGAMFDDVFGVDWTTEQRQSLGSNPTECPDDGDDDALEWRMIYRASKALAAGVNGRKAYIHMARTNGRTIFSPASKEPQDYDPEHGDAATVGETWRYGELPMLMRNLNVDQIISFWKQEDGSFSQHVEWDFEKDKDNKPRNYLQDIAMDAIPIHLPSVADRPPMKRSTEHDTRS